MIKKILRKIGMDGCVCNLPSGFHASVVLVEKEGWQKVVKIISKDCLRTKKSARLLAEDIVAYYQALKNIGVITPENDIRIIKNGQRYDLVIISPFCGHNVSSRIRSGTEKECLDTISSILAIVKRFFLHPVSSDSSELVCGLDPKPDNFTLDRAGQMHYVDLMPPRYRKDGRAIVEFPPPSSPAGYDLAYFRHFDSRGILLVLRTQLCRIRHDLRPQILELLTDFSRGFNNPCLKDYFDDFPGERFISAGPSERKEIIERLGDEDIYLIRDIATQVACENPLHFDRGWIEDIFHLTHFYDDVPAAENIKEIKKKLSAALKPR